MNNEQIQNLTTKVVAYLIKGGCNNVDAAKMATVARVKEVFLNGYKTPKQIANAIWYY